MLARESVNWARRITKNRPS